MKKKTAMKKKKDEKKSICPYCHLEQSTTLLRKVQTSGKKNSDCLCWT